MAVTKVHKAEYVYECLAEDTLPVLGVEQGAHAYETDTGKKYEFHGTAWSEWFDTHTAFSRFVDEQSKTLDSSGNIDIRSDALYVIVTLTPYSGTTDTLNTITGLKTAQHVIFQTGSGNTMTLDGTGTYTIKNSIGENSILNSSLDRWGGVFSGTYLVELFTP